MIKFPGKNVILWDFDGVLIDSATVREQGFIEVLEGFPRDEVAQLLEYHRRNGGLSRYAKFRYLYERIRKEKVSEDQVKLLAKKFSSLMRDTLTKRELLIADSLAFIIENYNQYQMHIISGSDENELQYLCEVLGIADYFISIAGSPTTKIKLVGRLLQKFQYSVGEILLIGDSINDFDAAVENKIDFYGYNNIDLKNKGAGYITTFC